MSEEECYDGGEYDGEERRPKTSVLQWLVKERLPRVNKFIELCLDVINSFLNCLEVSTLSCYLSNKFSASLGIV